MLFRSIQRRHQKIVEEAPAPDLPAEIRQAMGEAALQAAAAIGYVGAGTVEFLYENGQFYFMEMNTRLQVEHPVSEMITQQDLVAWQIKVAAGEKLPLTQDELSVYGHAIEVRLYAEDPNNNFLPTAGKIEDFIYPEATHFALDYESGVRMGSYTRMDSGVRSGDEISPFYDPMIAKLIVWGEDRSTAVRKLQNALHHTHITGLISNVRYLEKLVSLPAFEQAQLDTHFVEDQAQAIEQSEKTTERTQRLHQIFAAWSLYAQRTPQTITSNDVNSPWNNTSGWRLNSGDEDPIEFMTGGHKLSAQIQSLPSGKSSLVIEDHSYTLSVVGNKVESERESDHQTLTLMISGTDLLPNGADNQSAKAQVLHSGDSIQVHSAAGSSVFQRAERLTISHAEENDEHGLHAPMNGCLTEVRVKAGDKVNAGDVLVIMEAMKMEHSIKAPQDGTIAEVFFGEGDLVDEGSELLSFADED